MCLWSCFLEAKENTGTRFIQSSLTDLKSHETVILVQNNDHWIGLLLSLSLCPFIMLANAFLITVLTFVKKMAMGCVMYCGTIWLLYCLVLHLMFSLLCGLWSKNLDILLQCSCCGAKPLLHLYKGSSTNSFCKTVLLVLTVKGYSYLYTYLS